MDKIGHIKGVHKLWACLNSHRFNGLSADLYMADNNANDALHYINTQPLLFYYNKKRLWKYDAEYNCFCKHNTAISHTEHTQKITEQNSRLKSVKTLTIRVK